MRAAALAMVPTRDAVFGVISDLDDTVIQSHATNFLCNIQRSPERVAAVNALVDQIRVARSTLVLADDTLHAARHAAEHGWITEESLASIGQEKHADEGVTDEKAPAPGTPNDGDEAPTLVLAG